MRDDQVTAEFGDSSLARRFLLFLLGKFPGHCEDGFLGFVDGAVVNEDSTVRCLMRHDGDLAVVDFDFVGHGEGLWN